MKCLSPITISAALLVALAGCGSDGDTGRKLSRLTPTTDGECTEGVEACLAMEGGEPQCGCFVAEGPVTEGECDDQGGSVEPLPKPEVDALAAEIDCKENEVVMCAVTFEAETEEETTDCFCVGYDDESGSSPGGGEPGEPDFEGDATEVLESIPIDAVCVIPPADGDGVPLGPTPDPDPNP